MTKLFDPVSSLAWEYDALHRMFNSGCGSRQRYFLANYTSCDKRSSNKLKIITFLIIFMKSIEKERWGEFAKQRFLAMEVRKKISVYVNVSNSGVVAFNYAIFERFI